MEIKQIFIKCHDNDFWVHYLHALKQVFDYIDYFPHSDKTSFEKIENFIRKTLDNTYYLVSKTENKFPWEVKIFFNEDAQKVYEEIKLYGNLECAYMDIETYLITPGAKIEQFIFNV
jgi:hypothetical protein